MKNPIQKLYVVIWFFMLLLISLANPSQKLRAHRKQPSPTAFIQEDSITIQGFKTKQSYTEANPTYIAFGVCTAETCSNGYCKDKNTCVCKPGFAQGPSSDSKLCAYRLKRQMTAFLLELFLVVGVGHFYSGRYVFGGLKLLFIFSIMLFDLLVKYFFRSDKYMIQRGYNAVIYVLYFSVIFWQVFDVVMFGINRYSDGNDMPLWIWEGK